jgi:hypothetical protein
MKLCIAGSRDIEDYALVEKAIRLGLLALKIDSISEIVSGMAKGVDSLAITYATRHHLPVKEFHANWQKLGKKAGPIRNEQMAQYSDCLIAVSKDNSRGTNNMINQMNKLGKPVYVYTV